MADYIEREKIIEMAKCDVGISSNPTTVAAAATLIWLVSNKELFPAAAVAPVEHGFWIHAVGMNSQCSVCGKFFPVKDFWYMPFDINFCPACGAKMGGKEQE